MSRPPHIAATFAILLMWICLAHNSGNAAAAMQSPSATVEAMPDLKTILDKMAAHYRARDEFLRIYAVDREYTVENKRVNKKAVLNATMIFVVPEEVLVEIHDFSGSNFLRRGVINRLIDTERKNTLPDLRRKTAISVQNYSFEFLGQERIKDRPQYVLRARPRQKQELLFDGTIWVDAEDFAVTRIKGRPAKNPSFWTRKIEFVHEYAKFGAFWFPVQNTSVTSVFIFGRSTTEIHYGNYTINESHLCARAAAIRSSRQELEVQIDPKDRKK